MILIVDDEESIRDVLSRAFGDAGFLSAACAGPEEAMALVASYTPDVVLTDLIMPGMDGAEFCRRLRATPHLDLAVLILMTGMVSESAHSEEVVRGLDAGADDYLFKPFDVAEVVARVKAWLRVKHSRDKLAETAGRAEEALRHEQAFSEAVIASLADGLFVLSRDAAIMTCNQRALDLLGYSEPELLGRSFREVLARDAESGPGDLAALRDSLEQGAGLSREIDLTMRRRDGSLLSAALSCSLLRSRERAAPRLVVLVRDITLRKKYAAQLEAEVARRTEEIRASEEKYRALTENVSEAIVATDLENRLTSCNREACRLLEAPEEELLGRDLGAVAEGALGPVLAGGEREMLLASGGGSREVLVHLPGRKNVNLQVSASVLKDEAGRPGGIWYAMANLSERDALQQEIRRKELYVEALKRSRSRGTRMVGSSAATQELLVFVENTARADSPVLIEGESGVGKEVLAEEIHRRGARRDKPLVVVDCSALSESLLDSELFGHVKGAFTGATEDRAGLIEAAEGGTLFIDEIGEAPVGVQAKLLRVIEKGEYRRLGNVEVRHANVRVVAATNRKLQEEVRRKRFREDLYFRLKVLHVTIPPLREHKDDIPDLVEHFLSHGRVTVDRPKKIRRDALALLEQYAWPGNIRELANVIERAVILAGEAPHIGERHLPGEIQQQKAPIHTRKGTLDEIEKAAIEQALSDTEGNRSETARRLGLYRSSLLGKMRKYGLK